MYISDTNNAQLNSEWGANSSEAHRGWVDVRAQTKIREDFTISHNV